MVPRVVVVGEVHGGHAARAQLALEGVAVGHGFLEAMERIGHEGKIWTDWGRGEPVLASSPLRYRHRLIVVIIEEYQAATDDVTSLSLRPHLDLLRRLCPPLEPRIEVALEGLELCAELAGRRGAFGPRVEGRVFERRHDACDLGFQCRDRAFRLLELALRAAQFFARIALRGRGDSLALVHPPQRR